MSIDLRDAVFFSGLILAAVGWGLWYWPAALIWSGGVLVAKTVRI